MATQIQTAEPARTAADNTAARAIATTNLGDGNAPRAMFLPATMGEAMELARLMAGSNFVPPHLRGKPGDCLAVVMQANRWAMDPFAVGSKTYFVSDKIGYEAQLVNAVINASGVLDGRLHHEWEGKGNDLVCVVSGKLRGDGREKIRRVAINTITTRNSPLWKQDPEQQLAYFASRAWVRLNAPEVLMGIYTPDELSQSVGTAGAANDLKPEPRPLTAATLLGHSGSNDGTLSEDNPAATEGPADEERGERITDDLIAGMGDR